MPPPTNSDDELEVDVFVLVGHDPRASQRMVHFYPRVPFVVDGITYHPRQRGCHSRPMIEMLKEREG